MMPIQDQDSMSPNSPKRLLIEILSDRTPESLTRKELGSELSLEKGGFYFERIFLLLRLLQDCNFDLLPEKQLQDLTCVLTKIKKLIEDIEKYPSSTTNNLTRERDSYILQFKNNYMEWYDVISPIVAIAKPTEVYIQTFQQRANDIINKMKENQKKVEKTLDDVQLASGKIGVSKQAIYFKETEKQYWIEAILWLVVAVFLAHETYSWALYAFNILQIPGTPLNDVSFIQATISRFSVLLILIFSTLWCAKNYTAARHNQVINQHRENALNTFETFVNAASDDVQTKNAVLLQATQCIFSPQPTGYSNKGVEADSTPKIIEIVKDLSKMGK